METVLRSWLRPDPLPPEPANQNWVVLKPPGTPSGALRNAQLTRQFLLDKVARQPDLLWDSQWRSNWVNTLAFQRCVTWRYVEQGWPWP